MGAISSDRMDWFSRSRSKVRPRATVPANRIETQRMPAVTPGLGLSSAPLMKAKANTRQICTARNTVVYDDLPAAPLDAQVLADDGEDLGDEALLWMAR